MFWGHVVTGVSAAAIILIMSATGVLLTYQRQIQTWADTRGLDGSPPRPEAPPLSPDALVDRVRAELDGSPTGIRWTRDPHAPVEVLHGRETVFFVNAYTGAVLGDGSERARAFFRGVTDWHRWLALSGDGRTRGRAITGAANLAFLFIVLAGFYLWWPRNLTLSAFRNVLLFRRGLSSRARDFNWHNVIGIWSLVPLLLIIGSAVVISYAWAGALVARVADEGSSAPAASRETPEAPAMTAVPVGSANPGVASPPDAAALLERAQAQMPAWRSITMQLTPRRETVTFLLDAGTGGQPHRQARLTLSSVTGDVVAWEPFSSGARPQRVRSILRYSHTGEVLGVVGQTIAGLASAGAIVLVWTGISLALRRLRRWIVRRRREPVSTEAAGNAAAAGGKL